MTRTISNTIPKSTTSNVISLNANRTNKEKTVITHWTKKHCIQELLIDGVIQLEGYILDKMIKDNEHLTEEDGYEISGFNKAKKMQFKTVGRYIWFTEETKPVECIGNTDLQIPLSFHAEDIGARKWADVKKKMYKKTARKYASVLDKIAVDKGDDISKWWVLDTTVSMDMEITKKYKALNYKFADPLFMSELDDYMEAA